VLTSLLSNAVKFTEQGKVGVEAMLEASTPSEVEVHFVVHDTGIGIPKEKLGLIFDVFQQADDSTTRRYGGIGLGLTMSQQLARLMGGRIWAESEPDKGTTFHFTSRLKRQKVLEESAPAAQAEPEALHLRILLAEDSPTNQLIATTNLKKAGHTVQVANNGRKAVQAWEAGEFDLILMDMAMPEMDGLEVTQAIRQKEKGTGRHTPDIAMTAFALKEYQDKCRLAGMDGYVTKPVSPDELHRAITPFLAQRRKQPALPEKPSEPPVKLDEALEVVGGDLDLLRDVVQMSLNECPEQVQALRGAMDQQDAHGVERSAHRLKGILGNVGGMAAREAVQRLESMGTRGDLAGGPAALKRFEDELRRVVTFFSQPGWEKTIMVQQGG
jgi:CheY-like chemotaxis protein